MRAAAQLERVELDFLHGPSHETLPLIASVVDRLAWFRVEIAAVVRAWRLRVLCVWYGCACVRVCVCACVCDVCVLGENFTRVHRACSGMACPRFTL